SWRTRSTRWHELRLALPSAASRADATDAGTLRVAVVERGRASWYGPGFYGKRTACGITLEPDTVGVAHRTLPCGTQVEVQRGGRTVVAPVIDRGPFANGAVLDLTKPAADALRVDGVHAVRFLRRDDVARLETPASAPAMRR
ncbi:septal ring lytic transglycosylase RlpA family protein, partial [Patulibacter sp. S7RM1-6]